MNFASQFLSDKLKKVQNVIQSITDDDVVPTSPPPVSSQAEPVSQDPNDVNFSPYEIKILQTTFGQMMDNYRDRIALDIFEEVTQVEGIVNRLPETTKMRIGVIVVGCIERTLNVANNVDRLNEVIAEAKERSKREGISSSTLIECISRSKGIIVSRYLIKYHECSENDPSVIAANINAMKDQMQSSTCFRTFCETCSTWNRFFDYMCKAIDKPIVSERSSHESSSQNGGIIFKMANEDTSADSEVEFSEFELKLMKLTYQKLMRNQDLVAWEIREEIADTEEIASKIKENSGQMQVGFIVLTLIDRCLKVINDPAKLENEILEMKEVSKRHGISRKVLQDVIITGKSAVKFNIVKYHKCSENDTSVIAKNIKNMKNQMANDSSNTPMSFLSYCETCGTWDRFFDIISKQLEATSSKSKTTKNKSKHEELGLLDRVGSHFGRKPKVKEIDFADEEILILRSTYQHIQDERDKIAVAIFDSITQNDEVFPKIPEAINLRIGVIIISCLERCLEASSNPRKLSEALAEVKDRTKKQGISSRVFRVALKDSRPIIKKHLLQYHECPENDPQLIAANISQLKNKMSRGDEPAPCFLSYCSTCSTWNRFYDYTLNAFKS